MDRRTFVKGSAVVVGASTLPAGRVYAQAAQERTMERVLIDTFVVPEASKAPLLERAKEIARFLKTVPGFVEGYIYEKREGDSQYNVVTTAVWKDEGALENARKSAAEEFRKTGFNREEFVKQLGAQRSTAICDRSSY